MDFVHQVTYGEIISYLILPFIDETIAMIFRLCK